MRKFIGVLLLGCVTWIAPAQEPERLPTPAQGVHFHTLTSYAQLQKYLGQLEQTGRLKISTLATTREGRKVSLVHVAPLQRLGAGESQKTRVLLFAQQHGDEPSGKEALLLLLRRIALGEAEDLLVNIDLYIIPQMNPDGAERDERRATGNIDLNRDHVLLEAPQTKALHDLFLSILPHVTVDIHEFDAHSKLWEEGGFIKAGQVQMGMLTNLNVPTQIRTYQRERIFPHLKTRVEAQGYSFHDYIVGSPKTRVRHSTTEFNDGRQSFGILGTLSFIQEGRKLRTSVKQLEQRTLSQLASVEALLEFSSVNSTEIVTLVENARTKLSEFAFSEVITRMDHVAGDQKLSIPVEDLKTGKQRNWEVKPYHGTVVAKSKITAPMAYFIPAFAPSVQELLRRHNVKMEPAQVGTLYEVDEMVIDSLLREVIEEDMLPKPHVRLVTKTVRAKRGDMIVPVNQLQGMFVAMLLEADSQWGIAKFERFKAVMLPGYGYPVFRVREVLMTK